MTEELARLTPQVLTDGQATLDWARSLLRYGPDLEDVQVKNSQISDGYFQVATLRANMQASIQDAEIQLDQRRNNLYVQLRSRVGKTGRKQFTEKEIEAMTNLDAVVTEWSRRINKAKITLRLLSDLMSALYMASSGQESMMSGYGRERNARQRM